jgi:hypothetical protein
VFEELREREARRLNIVMHGVEEADGKEMSEERRAAWDGKKIAEVFTFLELGLTEDDVKFCRRVGGERRRPKSTYSWIFHRISEEHGTPVLKILG